MVNGKIPTKMNNVRDAGLLQVHQVCTKSCGNAALSDLLSIVAWCSVSGDQD